MKTIEIELNRHRPLDSASRRLFHGRGHCFPGFEDLVIDWFEPVVFVVLYQPRPEPFLTDLVDLLTSLSPTVATVLLQQRYLPGAPSRVLYGRLPEQVWAREGELSFKLRLGSAQNIGFFPDMAVGRSYVRELARGKKILNLFAYTCSFSVAAIAGAADKVVNLDMNRGALELGRQNHLANGLDLRKASFLALELFRSVSRLKKSAPFDLIVCDPPAAQGRSFQARRDWPKLLRKLPSLLVPGGEMLVCRSTPDLGAGYLENLFSDLCPTAQLIKRLLPGPDFPERDSDKGLMLLHYRFACR